MKKAVIVTREDGEESMIVNMFVNEKVTTTRNPTTILELYFKGRPIRLSNMKIE